MENAAHVIHVHMCAIDLHTYLHVTKYACAFTLCVCVCYLNQCILAYLFISPYHLFLLSSHHTKALA